MGGGWWQKTIRLLLSGSLCQKVSVLVVTITQFVAKKRIFIEKYTFEIAQSKPQAEEELPLPSLLNKYAFLTGLKSHAVRTWMLKCLLFLG